jgi:phenylalanyl-tRNA synthetase alpha chain
MAELTLNEKRLLNILFELGESTPDILAEKLGTSSESVIQYASLCQEKNLVKIEKSVYSQYFHTTEGAIYKEKGLPERQLLSCFSERIPLSELKTKSHLASIGIGWMRKKGWVVVKDGYVEKTGNAEKDQTEYALENPMEYPVPDELIKRGLIEERDEVRYRILILPQGRNLVAHGLDFREETGTLTREQILSGAWKTANFRRYDVSKLPKKAYPGKVHPYQRIIAEMREILLEMGFEELYGGIVQQSFWNFDALFQPQDHPAREMQDTFYLRERLPLPPGYEKVKNMHISGGDTSSTGWGGVWKEEKAEQCVLRTHTTSISIQYLAKNPKPPVKAFCVGRVYRRETIDTTHLAEFEQLEGIVMDENVTFGNLLGILREFYNRMGFESVRFKPSFYPYTEPSLDAEVYVDGIGWIEMGGAGVFREEVTAPLGVNYPVLAWGLGVSRIAMLRLGLKDLRLLHKSDVAFLREMPSLRPNKGGI